MRKFLLSLGIVFGLFLIPAIDAGSSVTSGPAFWPVVHAADSAEVAQVPQINVEVNKGGGRMWYASPVWVAIGVIGGVLVLMLIVMALRGRTTVVK
jgi:hypothetical protein